MSEAWERDEGSVSSSKGDDHRSTLRPRPPTADEGWDEGSSLRALPVQLWLHELEQIAGGADVLAATLRERNNLKRFLDALEDATYITDASGTIHYANPSFVARFGTLEQEAQRREFHRARMQQRAQHHGTNGAAVRARWTPPGSERSYDVLEVLVDMGRGEEARKLVVLRDLTEQERMERDREKRLHDLSDAQQELERQLVHADRLAAVGQLAAGVAHEINNPLAFVSANQTLLKEQISVLGQSLAHLRGSLLQQVPDEVGASLESMLTEDVLPSLELMKEALSDSERGAERIRRIVRSLGSFSRIEEDQIDSVDLNEVAKIACAMVRHQARHCAELIQVLREVPPIAADQGKLTQVLVNLLVNAVHAIEERGADHNAIRVTTGTAGGYVLLRVEDTGAGIPVAIQEKIFEPFFTTKPRQVGTGLGLALSAELIRKHRGEIRVESIVGQGTCFEVLLPLDTGLQLSTPAMLPSSSESSSPRRRQRRGRVLVIDDEPLILSAFRRLIGREHDVVLAQHGDEAIELLQADSRFDLIICDLMMPEVDGVMIYDALGVIAPELREKLIFCSGGAFTDRAKDFLAATVVAVLPKPIDFACVRSHIERSVAQSAGT